MTDEIRWREQHQQLEAQGYLWYRDHFRWGTTPAYRKPDGSSFRFIWFSEEGFEILKPSDLLARLQEVWRPAARADQDYAAFHLQPELQALPE